MTEAWGDVTGTYCLDCGVPLRPDNRSDICAECRWDRRNSRLRSIEREHQRQRRRAVVAEKLKKLTEPGEQP